MQCPKCGIRLPDSFLSHPFFTTGEPVTPPRRPGNCEKCGTRFPWNSKLRRVGRPLAGIVVKGWAEYKSLSALHLSVLLALLLIIIGVFTWRDLADILKGLMKK